MEKIISKIKKLLGRCKVKSKYVLFLLAVGVLILAAAIFCLTKVFFFKNESSPPPVPSKTATATMIQEADWVIGIPRIEVSAPVVLNVNAGDKDAYFKALEGGVAQMQGTALPGRGNTVIFGHSSFYASSEGNFKTVFKTLDHLEKGDEITLKSNYRTLVYEVTSSEMVSPDDVDVTKQTSEKKVTLITCWPPGTIDNRLVVSAKFVKQN